MKAFILALTAAVSAATAHAQTGAVGIGTTSPAASAALEISSTNRGVLMPRLSTAEIASIPSPQEGLLVYNKSTYQFWGYQRYDSLVTKTGEANFSNPLTASSPVVGQSFTVPVATRLTGLDLELTNPSTSFWQRVKVDLFNGAGYGGTLVSTDTVEVPANTPAGTLFRVTIPETAAAANSVFSVRLDCYTCAPSTHIIQVGALADPNNADPYPGGSRLNASGNSFGPVPIDLRFQAHGFVIGWQALEHKAIVR